MTTQRIDAYYAMLARERNLSAGSVRHVHAILRSASGHAVKWGWIPVNPAASASPPTIRRKEINPPTIVDTRRLLDAADAYDPEFAALLRVLTATGARRGEVCGLRWTDIDSGSRTLSIQRSVASIPGGTIVKDTKTHAARRIALDDDTIAILDQQLARLEHRAAVCGLEFNDGGYVFTMSADGSEPLHPDTITATYGRVQRLAGVKGVRLHDLRHLHATTLNVYAHFLEASDREAADVIGVLLDQHRRQRRRQAIGWRVPWKRCLMRPTQSTGQMALSCFPWRKRFARRRHGPPTQRQALRTSPTKSGTPS